MINTHPLVKPILFFTIVFLLYPVMTPLHEGLHWLQSDIDPDITPLRIELYSSRCFRMSALGITTISYNRPLTVKEYTHKETVQEVICYSVCTLMQLLIGYLVVVLIFIKDKHKTLSYELSKYNAVDSLR